MHELEEYDMLNQNNDAQDDLGNQQDSQIDINIKSEDRLNEAFLFENMSINDSHITNKKNKNKLSSFNLGNSHINSVNNSNNDEIEGDDLLQSNNYYLF